MSNPYRILVVLGIASASLSSCSRTNYAFQSTTPAYLGSERVVTSASQTPSLIEAEAPASLTAATSTTSLAEAPEALVAARALAHPSARVATKVVAPAAPVEVRATTSTTTRVERKAFKKELKRQLAGAPTGTTAEGKSQLIAALLCFFLGPLGVHDFYLGRPGKGIIQILLTLLFGIGVILVIIDLVRILLGTEKPKGGEYAKKL